MELETWYDQEIKLLRRHNLFREIPERNLKPERYFCSNDYLGLSDHPRLKDAAIRAVQAFGTGSGASRFLSGTLAPHVQLEEEVAGWFGKEKALLFNSGYQAGVGLIPVISRGGVIFSDVLNHASLIDGCRLSRAKVVVYRHRDMNHLESLLKDHLDHFPRWIVSESLFSMEGEKAPVADLVRLKKEHGTGLFLDEAHAVGVYGEKGTGVAEEAGIQPDVDLILGTFSKSLGSFGAFAVGNAKLMTVVANHARSLLFSTSLPPAVAEVSREAIRLARAMQVDRMALREHGRVARQVFQKLELQVRGSDAPIIPVIIGEPEQTLFFSSLLEAEGVWIPAIRPPTVPEGTSRLRVSLSLRHRREDYEALFQAFEKLTLLRSR